MERPTKSDAIDVAEFTLGNFKGQRFTVKAREDENNIINRKTNEKNTGLLFNEKNPVLIFV